MKANEIEDVKVLMIGDLVVGCIETDIVGEATYKIPCKVTDINHYGDVICEALKPFPNELDWHDGDNFSWIEPMPLTAEILEKNGFVANKYVHPYPYYEYINEEDKLKIGFAFPQGKWTSYYKEPWVYIDSRNVFVEHLPCMFVHQFQHALRLCRINKEID